MKASGSRNIRGGSAIVVRAADRGGVCVAADDRSEPRLNNAQIPDSQAANAFVE